MKRDHNLILIGLSVIAMFAPCAVCFGASRSSALLGEMLGMSPFPATYGQFFEVGEASLYFWVWTDLHVPNGH